MFTHPRRPCEEPESGQYASMLQNSSGGGFGTRTPLCPATKAAQAARMDVISIDNK
jgi:hypothetical protein